MLKSILTTLLIIFSLYGISQDNKDVSKSAHHVGVHVGSTTGFGFSYRYWPNKWGMQITGIPIFSKNRYLVSTGVSLLYLIDDNEKVDLYGYIGNHIKFAGKNQDHYDYMGNFIGTTKTQDLTHNIGVGIGIKVKPWKVLNLNIQFGYALKDLNKSIYTGLASEIGLYYHL